MMIKNRYLKLFSIVYLLGVSSIYAEDKPLSTETLTELKKTVNILKKTNISVVNGIDKGSYYFLQLDVKQKIGTKRVNAFFVKEDGAVYIGTRYEKNGTKAVFPKTAKNIATIKDGISFSYGNGKKELYVVTDPECPYCMKFEKEAQGKLEDYTVHVILYPLTFHKKSPAMIEWIMQGLNDAEKKHRMEEVMVNGSKAYAAFMSKKYEKFKYTDSIKTKVDNALIAGRVLGVTGTPIGYDEKYNKINLRSLLAPKKTKAAVIPK